MKYDIEYTLPNPKRTKWKESIYFETEFVLFGVNHENNLIVLRGNLQGDVEFYEWDEKIEDWNDIVIQAQPEIINTILIINQNYQNFPEKRLSNNNVFKSNLFIGGISVGGTPDYLQQISRITEMSTGNLLFLEQETMTYIMSSINVIDEKEFINDQLRKIPHRPIHPMYTIRWIQSQEYRALEDEEFYTFYENVFCVIGKKHHSDEISTGFFPLKEKILKIITTGNAGDIYIVTENNIFTYAIYENKIILIDQWKQKPSYSFIDIKYDSLYKFIVFHFSEKIDLYTRNLYTIQEKISVFLPKQQGKFSHQFDLKNETQVMLPSLEKNKFVFLEKSGNVVVYEV